MTWSSSAIYRVASTCRLAFAHATPNLDEVESVIVDLGLDGVRDQLPPTLSSGQRRRLALASCFVRPRRLLILDEPEQRLTPPAPMADRELARREGAGTAVLFASHDPDIVEQVADERARSRPLTVELTASLPGAGRGSPYVRRLRARPSSRTVATGRSDLYTIALAAAISAGLVVSSVASGCRFGGWRVTNVPSDALSGLVLAVGADAGGVRFWPCERSGRSMRTRAGMVAGHAGRPRQRSSCRPSGGQARPRDDVGLRTRAAVAGVASKNHACAAGPA